MERVYTTKTKSEIRAFIKSKLTKEFIKDIILAKSCGPNKLLNPKTKRCISKTGAVGKKLSVDSFATSHKIWVKLILQEFTAHELNEIYIEKVGKVSPPKKKCRPDQILNPKQIDALKEPVKSEKNY